MTARSFTRETRRRDFLLRFLSAGAFLGLGCSRFPAPGAAQGAPVSVENKHKFLEDAGMSFQDVYAFTFKRYFIPVLQGLGPYFKDGDLIDVLKASIDDLVMKEGQAGAKKRPQNDFAAFKAEALKSDRFWDHVLTFDVVEEADKALEFRVRECLWAKTFREAGAEDIGYATICYPDFASARAFNARIELLRTKTLMQGDDCCDHRWVWKG